MLTPRAIPPWTTPNTKNLPVVSPAHKMHHGRRGRHPRQLALVLRVMVAEPAITFY
jgi:hypothetical protein